MIHDMSIQFLQSLAVNTPLRERRKFAIKSVTDKYPCLNAYVLRADGIIERYQPAPNAQGYTKMRIHPKDELSRGKSDVYRIVPSPNI